MRYDTGERIWTDAQEQEIQRRLEGAEERLTGTPWRVTGGKLQGQAQRLQRARDEIRSASQRSAPRESIADALASMTDEEVEALHSALDAQPGDGI